MKYILQIHTGSWHAAHDRTEDIIRRIGEISSRIPVGKVIIGWNTDPAVYRETGAFLHGKGIQMLLWLPVFSEVNKAAETDGTLDVFGQRVLPPAAAEEEGFVFGCPSSGRNLQAVREIYGKYFSGCGFDGVFLDRIRSQSFFDMDSFPPDGEFRLKDAAAQRFFEAKEKIIADAVTETCRYFKGKGLTVGLDLFAPAVSRFVGQNYSLITKDADFIKPMLYRRTEAPAGIGYEYALFEKNAPGAQGRPKFSMDKAFLDTQLEAVGRVACEKYPGIEINYNEELVRTNAGYIRESLAAIRDRGFEGAALCWNVMQAPDAHIEAAAELQNKGGNIL